MKKLLPLLLLLISVSAFSQKVKVKKGIASVDKVPYLQMDIKKKLFAGVKIATFKSLDGQPLVEFNSYSQLTNFGSPYGWQSFEFVGTGITLEVDQMVVQNVKKPLIQFLYNNKLIIDGKVNEEALAKMKEQYPEPLTEQYKKKEVEEKEMSLLLNKVPERNMKGTVKVKGDEIYQAGVLIGYWETFRPEGDYYDKVRILNPDKIQAAVLLSGGKLKTAREGLKHDLAEFVTTNQDPERIRQMAVFLMKNGYL